MKNQWIHMTLTLWLVHYIYAVKSRCIMYHLNYYVSNLIFNGDKPVNLNNP